ncbi:AAA family ATPase [Aliivibrio wodanis]|uniref:AAA family ATPase n=1 Tax=Aliivibrio wodanis TaxID=80852 RepID=UPI00406CE2B7
MNNIIALNKQENSDDKHANVLMRIRTILESKDVTSSQLAKEVGVSPATISQILNGSYKADPAKNIDKLSSWLLLREQKANGPIINPGFVMTTTAQQIINDISFAHAVADDGIVVIYGSPGVGKSQAIKHYQNNNNNVWVIFACPSLSSLTAFLYEFALELGIPTPAKRKDELSRQITRRIRQSEGILIVDEAQHLGYETLEELRIIQEKVTLPMVLSGNKRTYAKMTGGARSEDFAQLFSRVAKRRGIHKTKEADVKAIADAWGITQQPERKMMIDISERPGGLRLLSKTLKLAAMFANGSAITEKTLRAAFQELETNE